MQIENGLKGRVGRLGLGMSKCDVGWERWTWREGKISDDSPGFWVLFVSLLIYFWGGKVGAPNSSSLSVDPEIAEVSRSMEDGGGPPSWQQLDAESGAQIFGRLCQIHHLKGLDSHLVIAAFRFYLFCFLIINNGTTLEPFRLDAMYNKLFLILESRCRASSAHFPLGSHCREFRVISMLISSNALYFCVFVQRIKMYNLFPMP